MMWRRAITAAMGVLIAALVLVVDHPPVRAQTGVTGD